MKVFGKWIVLALFFCAVSGCGKEKFSVPDQRTEIEKYLRNHHDARDTTAIGGIYRAFFDDRDSVLLADAPELTDSAAVVAMLGAKIAGNPLADAPPADSLRAWAARLGTVGGGIDRKTTGWGYDLGPSLDFCVRMLTVYAGELDRLDSQVARRADLIRQDRDTLNRLSGQIVDRGRTMQQISEIMYEVAAWPAPGDIAPGDEVLFYYSGHVFNPSAGVGELFTTNGEPFHDFSGGTGMYPLLMDGMRVKVGDGRLVAGINQGLEGSLRENSYLLFLTADQAYGDRYLGTVPAGSPVVFRIDIREVIKQQP
jgi:hypothetical protein